MVKPMTGVRVLEVAQFTFVPAAGAVLADWGAEVVKVEHAERGDAQRGLVQALGQDVTSKGSSFAPLMEGPNRGKRSIGLALDQAGGREVLMDLVRRSDVFLTNYLPSVRDKLGIDERTIRSANPDIVYTVGSGFGHSGPEADKGGYDSTAFWARGGSGDSATPPGADRISMMPTGAYGDFIGGMTIAAGIAAALYRRAIGEEAPTVDVSLLGVGAWATQLNVNLALMAGGPLPKMKPGQGARSNPLAGAYVTADGRWVMLTMLQPGKYWPEFCTAMKRPDLITDPRFADVKALMTNAAEASVIVKQLIGDLTKDELVAALDTIDGPWALMQNTYEVGHDPALTAIGQIADVVDAEGVTRRLVGSPVQFDREPADLTRAPAFAEHTDEILAELGLPEDRVLELKIAGAVT